MKFVKKNVKWIVLVIVLLILTGGVSVYATATYLATNVSYTKTGTNVSTVAEALNDLYSKQNTTISNLEATNNNLSNQVDNLTTQLSNVTNSGAYGEFTPTDLTVKHINVGFRPSKVILVIPISNTNHYSQYIYNGYGNDAMEGLYIFRGESTDNRAGVIENYNKSNIGFSVNDTGFYYKPVSADNKVKTYWFAVK